MTTASQLKKPGTEARWLVKNEQGETFGPVDFETLKSWAIDGRLAPTNTLSENATTWAAVTNYPELEMNWVAEVSPGAFYGPIHKLALEALQKEGAIPVGAVTFQRPPPIQSSHKTQPVSPLSPVFPPVPAQRSEPEALHALERQLDLERQRSHDLLKQLREVELQAAASDARVGAYETAQLHTAAQSEQTRVELAAHAEKTQIALAAHSEQTRGELAARLDHLNTYLGQIHEQVREKETALHPPVHPSASAEKLEALVHACLTRLEQQALAVTPPVELASSQAQPLPVREEAPHLLLAALKEMQSQLARQLTEGFAQAQERQRHETLSAHDQATQRLAEEREKTHLAFQTSLVALQTHLSSDLRQTFHAELAQTQTRLTEVLAAAQREGVSQTTQASAQALVPLVAQLSEHQQALGRFEALLIASRSQTSDAYVASISSIAAQVSEHQQALGRFEALLTTSRSQTSDAFVTSVTALLAREREELVRKTGEALTARLDPLYERIQATLTQGRDQMMRATGDSQRLAIEYMVRELQATQQVLERELKCLLEAQEKAAQRPHPERTYVEVEAVEVLEPERPRKKTKPEPELVEPPSATQPAASRPPGQNISMADIEQQARRELERLGAQGMNLFKRKK